jgi:hypothetical protein
MGIPKWVKADFIEDFPLMIASSGIGAFIGLLIGSTSGHSSSHLNALWIVGSLILTIAGLGLWLYRGAKRHEKNPDGIGFPEVHREIADLRVALHIPGVTQDHEILVKEETRSQSLWLQRPFLPEHRFRQRLELARSHSLFRPAAYLERARMATFTSPFPKVKQSFSRTGAPSRHNSLQRLNRFQR